MLLTVIVTCMIATWPLQALLLRAIDLAAHYLCMFSVASLPTDPGHNLEGGVLEVACQHHLAVVYAEEGPNPLCGTQQLAYTVSFVGVLVVGSC